MVIASSIQKELLEKHGKTVLIDSSFGTNKYGFSLFTLMVVDEHNNGFPAAWFIVSNEKEETIATALRLVKEAVPGWKMKNGAYNYYGKGGWAGFEWQGVHRMRFAFRQAQARTADLSDYVHASTTEGVISRGSLLGNCFAGIQG